MVCSMTGYGLAFPKNSKWLWKVNKQMLRYQQRGRENSSLLPSYCNLRTLRPLRRSRANAELLDEWCLLDEVAREEDAKLTAGHRDLNERLHPARLWHCMLIITQWIQYTTKFHQYLLAV